MHANNRMKLVRDAMTIFMQSLPVGCHFSIVSYGTDYEYLRYQEGAVPPKPKPDDFDQNFPRNSYRETGNHPPGDISIKYSEASKNWAIAHIANF